MNWISKRWPKIAWWLHGSV